MGKRTDIEAGVHVMQMPPPAAPRSWCPWLVPLIFAADIAIFVYTMYVNDCPANTGADKCVLYDDLKRYSFQPLRENPIFGPSAATLKRLGALDPELILQNHESWRLFSCIWLHAGVVHLLANMLSLLSVGLSLEQDFGFLKIGLLYVLSGFGGSLMSSLSPRPIISVGASGALLGILGAMLSDVITNWTIYTNKCAAITNLMIVIILNLILGLIPQVDSAAHLGGFLSGFLLGFIVLMRPQYGYISQKYIAAGYNVKHKKSKYKCYQFLLWIIALGFLILGYLWGLGMLYSGRKIEIIPKISHDHL